MWLNILNSRWLLGTRVEWQTYLGAGIGVAGILVLFWPQVQELSPATGRVAPSALASCRANRQARDEASAGWASQ